MGGKRTARGAASKKSAAATTTRITALNERSALRDGWSPSGFQPFSSFLETAWRQAPCIVWRRGDPLRPAPKAPRRE
jgi:hypothetical protein